MTYATTMTQKGQITIPKQLRDRFGLKRRLKVRIDVQPNGSVTLRPARTILDFAGTFKVSKPQNAVKLRTEMERLYARR